MPYLHEELRRRIDKESYIPVMWTAGELNYFITRVILRFLTQHGEDYSTMNDILGALTHVQHEFQRRVVDVHESGKILENGDVYERD